MSASGAGGPRVRRLFRRAAETDNIGQAIFRGIVAVVGAIGTALASGILTLADLLIIPAQALGINLGALVDAIFGGAAFIIRAGAAATGISIGPNGLFASPLSFALAVGAVLLALYLVVRYLALPETGNLIAGLPFDFPSPGIEDPEEEEGDA
jgi:hypothetical protein